MIFFLHYKLVIKLKYGRLTKKIKIWSIYIYSFLLAVHENYTQHWTPDNNTQHWHSDLQNLLRKVETYIIWSHHLNCTFYTRMIRYIYIYAFELLYILSQTQRQTNLCEWKLKKFNVAYEYDMTILMKSTHLFLSNRSNVYLK